MNNSGDSLYLQLPKNIFSDALTCLDIDELEAARQLTISAFSIYKSVRATEFFGQRWSKEKVSMDTTNGLAGSNVIPLTDPPSFAQRYQDD